MWLQRFLYYNIASCWKRMRIILPYILRCQRQDAGIIALKVLEGAPMRDNHHKVAWTVCMQLLDGQSIIIMHSLL